MLTLIFFLVITLLLYINAQNFFDSQSLLEYTSYIVGLSAIFCFAFLYIGDFSSKINFYFLAFIPLFVSSIVLIKKKTKAKSLEILAKQQRYFDEAHPKELVNFYKVRKDIKKDRVETLVNKESKKLMKNALIVPQFFLDFHSFTPTPIQSLDDLNKNAVFKAVFEKVKTFIQSKEVKVDFNKVLEENDKKAEFFLMPLWEEHTKIFNISLANLELLAHNEKDKEFLGALDLLNLNCVKRKGAVLFYKYMEFKNRIKDYVKYKDK